MNLKERQADPRYQLAGSLFDARLPLMPGWGQMSIHARVVIRYLVQELALGPGDALHDDPDKELREGFFRFTRAETARLLLAECRSIARSAARGTPS